MRPGPRPTGYNRAVAVTQGRERTDRHHDRLRRRSRSLPAVVGLAALSVLLAPLLVPAAVLVDLLRRRPALPTLRLWGFLVQFLLLELAAVSAAAVLWLAFGAGRFLGTDRAVAVHGRVQWWWAGQVLAAARRTLGLRFDEQDVAPCTPGPVIVLGRHSSYGDALLPAVLFGTRHRLQLRYVIAKGLAWDPALDLFGHRLRNHFVDRAAPTGSELLAIGRLARGMDTDDAAVIFPEGQFPTEARRDRVLERLRRDDPAAAERAARLRHLLPPRPGGVLALLGGAPAGTDVIILGHAGFEGFSTVGELWRNVPMRRPVAVRTWRVRAAEVPSDRKARVEWLTARWEELDGWIDDELARRAALDDRGQAGGDRP